MEKIFSGERFVPEECDKEMLIEHYQRYQFARMFVKGRQVLDAACGDGYGSHILSECAKSVMGLDIDENVVRRANAKYKKSNLSYTAGSVDKLPFADGEFDVIVSFETIEHIDGRAQQMCLSEMKRVLKKDGMLIMSTPNKKVYTDLVNGKNEFHIKEFYIDEFLEFLNGAFQKLKVYHQFPQTGYFIAKEQDTFSLSETAGREVSRYVIAVCSDTDIGLNPDTGSVSRFDNTMYYFLNRRAHELEELNLNMKLEADAFEKQQEEAIQAQKETIQRLEQTIEEQKQYVLHLERDISDLKERLASFQSLRTGVRKIFKK